MSEISGGDRECEISGGADERGRTEALEVKRGSPPLHRLAPRGAASAQPTVYGRWPMLSPKAVSGLLREEPEEEEEEESLAHV